MFRRPCLSSSFKSSRSGYDESVTRVQRFPLNGMSDHSSITTKVQVSRLFKLPQ